LSASDSNDRRPAPDRAPAPRRNDTAPWQPVTLDSTAGVDLDEAGLVAAAVDARTRARARYSGFQVGAALQTDTGEVVTGCNIENASFGLTLCAERVAVFKAVSEGIRGFDAIAVVADARDQTAPCGPCRQIIWEFCGDIWVHMVGRGGKAKTWRMRELLPLPFDQDSM
jgi:cytidine deaminase